MIKRTVLLSILSVAGVLALGALSLLLLTSFKAEAAMSEHVEEPRMVRTRRLISAREQVMIEADGFLEPARSMDIVSPVAGIVADSYGALEGGTEVAQGQEILTLDDRRSRLAFESARTEMVRITFGYVTSAGLNESDLEEWNHYVKNLYTADFRALPAVPDTEGRAGLLAATMGVVSAGHALESAAIDLSDHRINAAFDGTLIGEGVVSGTWVSPGVPLATLAETGRMDLPLSLPVKDLSHLSVGDEVLIERSEDGAELSGEISRIEPMLNAGSQTARLHVSLTIPAGSGWIAGSYVRARISGNVFESALRVPRSSLSAGRLPLYLDGELVLMPVNILAYDASDIILAPDIPAEAELVETILQTPLDGMPLRREYGS